MLRELKCLECISITSLLKESDKLFYIKSEFRIPSRSFSEKQIAVKHLEYFFVVFVLFSCCFLLLFFEKENKSKLKFS